MSAKGEQLVALSSGHTIRIGESTESASPRFLGYRLEDDVPIFRYRINDALVEQRIDVSDSHVTQTFVVRRATADVFYVGNTEAKFSSTTGQRDGETIRYPKADAIEFEIEMPLSGSSGK